MTTNNNGNAESIKIQGNLAFAKKEYLTAIDLFTKAIDLDSLQAVYYTNRAAAYMMLKQYTQARHDLLVYIFYIFIMNANNHP